MKAQKVIVGIVMIAVFVAGACVLISAVTRSQASYHPPVGDSASPRVIAHSPDSWRPATEAEKAGAAKAIRGQLDAFKKDDYVTAAGYQSVVLKGNFPTVMAFKQVITQGYPEFAHYKSVTFGAARSDVANQTVSVVANLVGEDGIKVTGVYFMRKENGAYRVAGVQGGQHPAPPPRPRSKPIPPPIPHGNPMKT